MEKDEGRGRRLSIKDSARHPLWLHKLRENCLRRVKEERNGLLWKARLSADQSPTQKEFVESTVREIVSDELQRFQSSGLSGRSEIPISTAKVDEDMLWEYDGLHTASQLECEEVMLELQRMFYEDIRINQTHRDGCNGSTEDEEEDYLDLAIFENLRLEDDEWIFGHMRKDQDRDVWEDGEESPVRTFGSDEEVPSGVPTQVQSLVEGSGAVLVSEFKPVPDVDYLQELLAIQQQGPRSIGFFGTRNMGFTHQELIEILSYAMVITKNHIYTSGASGTNAAVIRGALRAEKPELLTVILPQSLKKQPPESQELLSKVKNVIEKPYNDHLPLIEASRLCNMDIISHVQQVICFAFHDSRLLMETCQEAKNLRKIVTLFYLD